MIICTIQSCQYTTKNKRLVQIDYYTPQSNDSVLAALGIHEVTRKRIQYNDSGTVMWERIESISQHNDEGQQVSIERFNYVTEKRRESNKRSSREVVKFYYTVGNLLSKEEVVKYYADGTISQYTYLYTYDDHHQVNRFESRNGIDTFVFYTAYTYEDDGRVMKKYDSTYHKHTLCKEEGEKQYTVGFSYYDYKADTLVRDDKYFYEVKNGLLLKRTGRLDWWKESTFKYDDKRRVVEEAISNFGPKGEELPPVDIRYFQYNQLGLLEVEKWTMSGQMKYKIEVMYN
ncbi:hypothetical protein LX64_00543 [Chitinophaga skermanii]|uniref:Uncharacterized protein n=2 Tax=Chitinophaga skermanii TaxID=331697 RepID=A0A327R296_9BACT|nr:hypothetical protein LX64_00543 [Chitinophaga skermanii]